jgi:hypothetical protein
MSTRILASLEAPIPCYLQWKESTPMNAESFDHVDWVPLIEIDLSGL